MNPIANYIPSNLSIEEIIKLYGDSLPSALVTKLDKLMDEVVSLEKEITRLSRDNELVEEQAEFGRELVRQIDKAVESHTRFKEFKNQYEILREDTYFEI